MGKLYWKDAGIKEQDEYRSHFFRLKAYYNLAQRQSHGMATPWVNNANMICVPEGQHRFDNFILKPKALSLRNLALGWDIMGFQPGE